MAYGPYGYTENLLVFCYLLFCLFGSLYAYGNLSALTAYYVFAKQALKSFFIDIKQ